MEDLEFFVPLDASANFSDMGCFKTTTAEFLAEDIGAQRILVVTSKTGKITYEQTLPYVLGDIPVYRIESQNTPPALGHTHHRREKAERGVFLAHYNLFTRRSAVAKAIRSASFDLAILDESHRIKNRNAQCSQQLWYIKADVRHIMTGSPYVNDPSDLWSQIRFLTKDMPGFWEFASYFCEFDVDDEESVRRGYRKIIGINQEHKQELKDLIYSFARRRTKREVFPELPPKIRYTHEVSLNRVQQRMYNEIKAELMSLDQAGVPFYSPNVLSALSRLRQITAATPQVRGRRWLEREERWVYDIELIEPSSKLDAVMDVLADTTNPVVIFYQHRDTGKLLNRRLERASVSYHNMLERDSEQVRLSKVNSFQRGNAKVFHCTAALGSESITLTRADSAIFVDRAWTPKDNNQAEDRVHRPGQTLPTNIVDIYARGTIDGYVRAKVARKQGWFKEIFQV
jgi:SNF2 family DNA or RNA helicase